MDLCKSIVQHCHLLNKELTSHSDIVSSLPHTTPSSTMEASDSEVRVAVSIPLLESVRTPRNAGVPCVLSVLLVLKAILNTWPCGGVMSHSTTLPVECR